VPAFDRVLIESSGIASPAGIIDLIVMSLLLAARFHLDRVVATVDAIDGLATLREFDEAEEQVAVADRLVLTKLDLVAPAEPELAELKALLQALNPFAAVTSAGDAVAGLFSAHQAGPPGRARAADVLAQVKVADACAHRHAAHESRLASLQGGHDIETTAFLEEEAVSLDFLQLFLDAVARDAGRGLLRVKGLVNVAERPGQPAVINGARSVPHAIEWLPAWPSADRRSRLVLITRGVARERLVDTWHTVRRFAARSSIASAAS
jgi:G3E family GTPase